MAVVVIADLKAKGGFVNKDTIAGGYGSRFYGDSFATSFAINIRRIFQNVPSITVSYLDSIFQQAGHKIVVTHDDTRVEGDLRLVLTSLTDYKHESNLAVAA